MNSAMHGASASDSLRLLERWYDAACRTVWHMGSMRGPSIARLDLFRDPWPSRESGIDGSRVADIIVSMTGIDLRPNIHRIEYSVECWHAKQEKIVSMIEQLAGSRGARRNRPCPRWGRGKGHPLDRSRRLPVGG